MSNVLYRGLPDWNPVEAVWISWPHQIQTWPGRFDRVPAFFARWVEAIAESHPVNILVPHGLKQSAQNLVAARHNIEWFDIPTDDCWIRDYGPTFVVDERGTLNGINWRYNAWGGKYPPWDNDNAVAPQVCSILGIDCIDIDLCLEGGALNIDDHGRMLTTKSSLLCDSRNPHVSQSTFAKAFFHYLGVDEIVWVEDVAFDGDDTDGHIDQLARFVDSQNVVVAGCGDSDDPNHHQLSNLQSQIRLWSGSTHPRVKTHVLPIPPKRCIAGQRVPESYVNFQRLDDRILVPTFDAPTDDIAIGQLKDLTGCDVVGIDCRDLVWGLGALHCASLEQPRIELQKTS